MRAGINTRRKIAPSTLYQYERALARLEVALNGRTLDDAALADYLSKLFKTGKSRGTAQLVVSAVRFRARLAGEADLIGPSTNFVLAENRYENLSPEAEARLVDGIRLHAKLLGKPDADRSDSKVLEEFKKRDRWIQKLKFGQGRMPEGRRFMGELYRQDLDYPQTLLKGSHFRTCRACKRQDSRMSGIYWCFACAVMIKEARRRIRGRIGLLTSIFGRSGLRGDFEWKSLVDAVRLIRTRPRHR